MVSYKVTQRKMNGNKFKPKNPYHVLEELGFTLWFSMSNGTFF